MTKKIMFNDKYCLTQAVLSGTKTMTRRSVPLSLLDEYDTWYEDFIYKPIGEENYLSLEEYVLKRTAYKAGEVVAIAQSYKEIYTEKIADFAKRNYHLPREDAAEKFRKLHDTCAGWHNKMFVKADLMSHHIKITDVKVESLQDISDEDILREGIRKESFADGCMFCYSKAYMRNGNRLVEPIYNTTPRRAFASIMYKIIGGHMWESNPWVVAYSFELVD